MKRSAWLKSKIGVILLPALFIAITGCGAGTGGTGGAISSGGTTGGTTTGGTSGGGTTGGGTTGGGAASLSATVSWTPVTTNTDGSPLTELAGYRVHYGTQSGNYTTTVDITDPAAANAIISNLQAGTTYYFVVTAYDTSGNQSQYSNEGVKAL